MKTKMKKKNKKIKKYWKINLVKYSLIMNKQLKIYKIIFKKDFKVKKQHQSIK